MWTLEFVITYQQHITVNLTSCFNKLRILELPTRIEFGNRMNSAQFIYLIVLLYLSIVDLVWVEINTKYAYF